MDVKCQDEGCQAGITISTILHMKTTQKTAKRQHTTYDYHENEYKYLEFTETC